MQSINILLVCQSNKQLAAAQQLIRRTDVVVFATTYAEEALQLAWRHDIAVALIDVDLPHTDGLELTKLLKISAATKNILVILLTEPEKLTKHLIQGTAAGAVDVLIKPIDSIVFNTKLEIFIALFEQNNAHVRNKKSYEQYEAIFRRSGTILMVVRASDFQIVEVNAVAGHILGYDLDIIKQKTLLDLIPEIELDDVRQILESATDSEAVLNFESQFTTNTPHVSVWLNVKLTYDNPYFYINASDMSDYHQIITTLVDARKQTQNEKNNTDSFLANMSHEIRTPISGIMGLVELLSDTQLGAEQRDMLHLIRSTSANLLGIINDILDLSKVEAGQLDLDAVDYDLNQAISSLISLMNIKAKQKGTVITYEIDNKVPRLLVGDPLRVNQILLNLVSNAVKFTEKGKVDLKVNLLEVIDSDQIRLEFTIKDTGTGIPKQYIDKLFNDYEQGDKSTARKFGGTGLGLSIVKKLVAMHQGSISVKSDEGKGSTFAFTILTKVSKQTPILKQNISLTYKELSGRRALLVEDNMVNQLVGKRILEKWEMIVNTAKNGLEALDRVKEHYYDVILMDIQMPEMNGYESSKIIREMTDNINQLAPIVALTAAVLPGERELAIDSGMNDVITKPFDSENLYLKLVELILGTVAADKKDLQTPQNNEKTIDTEQKTQPKIRKEIEQAIEIDAINPMQADLNSQAPNHSSDLNEGIVLVEKNEETQPMPKDELNEPNPTQDFDAFMRKEYEALFELITNSKI